ncbi:MAG: class II aldolase/adducin family protein [Synergistaceae bacterium]|jgi:ribulose-5-phosphate 4-epimerase/fuculose-1-phosphate aldolase|nr:class II aldolase/adducin family protein [Synergistaceae bacterium]
MNVDKVDEVDNADESNVDGNNAEEGNMTAEKIIEQAIWAARSFYDRGKTSGSSANLSVRLGEDIYITVTGSCFGCLSAADFVRISRGSPVPGHKKPSRELPLHLALYGRDETAGAVIHIHSTYATLWSCLPHPDEDDVLPSCTPHLRAKLGRVASVPYAEPGSEELFAAFRARVGGQNGREPNGYLLRNHGPIVAGKTLMDAYFSMEELEDAAKIAWLLKDFPDREKL